jgi:hypothetical protein
MIVSLAMMEIADLFVDLRVILYDPWGRQGLRVMYGIASFGSFFVVLIYTAKLTKIFKDEDDFDSV